VAGIGEKTAITLLHTYNTLEGIYDHLDELSAGVRSKLETGREQAALSRKLAQIVTDLPMKIDLEKARPQHFEPAAVEALFRELEFRTLMTRLQNLMQTYGIASQTKSVEPVKGQQLALFAEEKPVIQVSTPANTEIQTHIVNTPQALVDLVGYENSNRLIDTETMTDQMRADLVGISLATNGDQGYYIPLGHKTQSEAQLPIAVVLDALRGPLCDKRIRKIGHNVKYDFIVLARYGLRVEPLSFDTMIAEWLTNPNSSNLGLKNLAWVRLDYRMTEIEELIGKGSKQISMADVPISQAAAYAAADAAVTLRLILCSKRRCSVPRQPNYSKKSKCPWSPYSPIWRWQALL
jgi:DNA polymerase-1